MSDQVIVVDDEYQIHYLNSFIERHASLQLSEVQGKSLFSVFADLPEAIINIQEIIDHAQANKIETIHSIHPLHFFAEASRRHCS